MAEEYVPLSEEQAHAKARGALIKAGAVAPNAQQIADVLACSNSINEVIGDPTMTASEIKFEVQKGFAACAADVASQVVPNHSGKGSITRNK